ncbi:ISAzo13-like element transposase-related protein [Roseateles sp. GG27B]
MKLRKFCHITRHWRGRPLESVEVVLKLTASTGITKGLHLRATRDTDDCATRFKVADVTMASASLIANQFNGN